MRKFEYEPVECQSAPFSLHSLSGYPLGHRHLAVMWYGALHRNTNDPSQPLASVLLHDVQDYKLTGEFRCTKVSALNLGLLPIGSVWHKGKIVAKEKLMTKRFEVDFSNDGWDHYCLKGDNNPPIPASVYPLFKPCREEIADAWMLRFHIGNGITLIIPSLEFFTRCYGSSRLRRSLLTLPWDEAEERLFPQPTEPPPTQKKNEWQIYLPPPHTEADIPLLAHVKYDPYAKTQAKWIVSQMLSHDPNQRLFLKVAPWTNQKGKIDVSGFYIEETKTFIGLNIIGMGLRTHPQYIVYKTRSSAKTSGDEATTNSGSNITSQPEYTDPELLDDESPAQGRGLTKFQEPPFVWIDEQPLLTRYIDRDCAHKKSQKDQKQDVTTNEGTTPRSDMVSTGTAYGTNSEASEALTHSKLEENSTDQLWNMWVSLTRYAKDHPNIISGVYHYSIGTGFQKSGIPQLINFPLTRTKHGSDGTNNKKLIEAKERGIQRFPIVYGNPPNRRGILLLKVSLKINHFYIIEIQHINDVKGEYYAGLSFWETDEEDFEKFLSDLLEKIKLANGHVTELAKKWKYGKAFAYWHKKSDKASFTFENVVKTILVKMST